MAQKIIISFSDHDNHPGVEVDVLSLMRTPCCSDHELLRKIGHVISMIRSETTNVEVDVRIEVHLKDPLTVLSKISQQLRRDTDKFNGILSLRERQVLELLVQGMTNKEISSRLYISYETARSHRKSIIRKAHVRNTAALVSYYKDSFGF